MELFMNRKIDWPKVTSFILDELFFSQTELAKRCKVTQQSISNWRMSFRSPGPYAKRQLAGILEESGNRINSFRIGYDPSLPDDEDVNLKELIRLYHTLPKQQQEFLIDLTHYLLKKNG